MSRRADNRASYPKLASLVDLVRERYPDARLVAGIENGREIGKVDDELRRLASLPPPTETELERLYRQYAEERKNRYRRV